LSRIAPARVERPFSPRISILARLVEAGADLKVLNNHGQSLLSRAVFANDPELVRYLLKKGLDVNQQDGSGITPLSYSGFQLEAPSVTELSNELIVAGAQVDSRDQAGETALIRAANRGNLSLMKSLLAAHADINIKDHGGRSALVKATPDARNLLLEKGAKIGDQAAIMASWDLNACASEATANRNLSSFALGVVDNMNRQLGKSSSETDMALTASLFASRTECKNLTSLKVEGRRLANTATLEHEGIALRFHDIAIICNTGKDGKIECKNANP
jgi:Ankyrin repeats (many copies)